MLMEMERDSLPGLARRCVDQALGEAGLHNLDCPTYDVACRAVIIGMKHAAEAVRDVRQLAERLAATANPYPPPR